MSKTADNHTKKTSNGLDSHLNFNEGSYLETTSRPLYALFFLLPLIVLYEIGTFMFLTDSMGQVQLRIAAFTWLMEFTRWIGVDPSIAWAFPGLLVLTILLCWHLSSRFSWSVNPLRLLWMWLESVLLTLPLFLFSILVNSSRSFMVATPGLHEGEYLANLITSVGAGIYEELMFRLILIGLILLLFEDVLKVKKGPAWLFAIAISALLFALHHYIGLVDGHIVRLEELKAGSFIFRTFAGLYFAIIFRYRGYGITAGTHVAYNVIYYTISHFF